MLNGKRILIGVTGSIAAFKIPFLVRLLVREGAEVQVILTPSARDFVTPITLSTLSSRPVYTLSFDTADGTWNSHVEMGRWADIMIIAPASANTLGKMASGIADNLLLTTFLSAKCPVFFAPAMDLDMYRHPSTKESIRKLLEFGHYLIEPQVGELASGLTGAGRMEEPENIVEIIRSFFSDQHKLSGIKALVTAGPTHEPLDPVRYIGNRSTGTMGYAIAETLAAMGAEVTLVSGPVALEVPSNVRNCIKVETAEEMLNACLEQFPSCNLLIMTAAVADFRPSVYSASKIKKGTSVPEIPLEPTADILYNLGQLKQKHQMIVGFALETDNETDHALQKLHTKNMDMIVLNSLNDEGAGFGPTNKISIILKDGSVIGFQAKSKKEVANDIVNQVIIALRGK